VAHCLWWQILGELASDGTGVTVWSADFAPNDSSSVSGGANISGVGLCLRLVDVSDSFSKVKLSIFLVVNTLKLDERGFFVLIAKTTSVTGEDTLSVKTAHDDELKFFWSDFC